ncbi:hypothetical protein FOA43_004042 [Brettanomyces nanus]|uniref:Glutathione hydrolase n=1 Tax=Eeniella nana TaxID=13502 RepID=A0A875RQD9_EENNA|nr:uncharacterized protein FOA43_004042 [Brettanomyces nanus]QPG76650.1 hypothetical protein FOA43_004042 [Brettanomyces nanus]
MTSETSPLIGIPTYKRKRPLFIAALVVAGLLLVLQIKFSDTHKYPPPPKIPAHIPFIGGPTWQVNNNDTVVATHGAVASDLERCSDLGVSILQKGGSAADAAVTTCLCIGALDTMFSSGIGGGAFITSKLAGTDTDAISIDAREMAPAAASRDMFQGREIASKYGGLAVAIPGELRGLYTLYKEHGSGNLTWPELITPVADIVRHGWKVSKHLALAFEIQEPAIRFYRKDWQFAFNSNGKLKQAGDWISRPALADTLDAVARNGSDAIFYDPNGRIAQSLAAKTRETSGILTAEDFSFYRAVVEPAVAFKGFSSRNLTVYTANGSSSGVALLAGLALADGFDEVNGTDFEAVPTQRLVESMKWLASVRTHLGDVGVFNTNATARQEHCERYSQFLTTQWIGRTREKIRDDRTLPSWKDYEPAYQANDPHGTSSLSVVDSWNNAVTITTTVNLLFGSVVHDPVTGIILNNEMDDFSIPTTQNAFDLRPSVYNYIEPLKRPLSSSAQTIVYDPATGRVDLVIGAAGGSRIPTAILQALIRIYHYDMNITDTIAFPRLHHQLIPEVLYVEDPLNTEMVKQMQLRGHTVEDVTHMTAMNGIRIKHGKLYAQSDYWRKLGIAAGY